MTECSEVPNAAIFNANRDQSMLLHDFRFGQCGQMKTTFRGILELQRLALVRSSTSISGPSDYRY